MKLRLLIALLAVPATAWGQGAVVQSGVVVPNNFAAWSANGIIKDSGVNSITLDFPTIANSHLIGNATGSSHAAQDTSLTALIDTLGSPAQGDILYRNSSGWVYLAPGSSGQFLKTLGASANPIWDDVPATTYTGSSSITLTGSAFSITAPVTVPNGGTGLVSGTSGGVLAFTASGTINSSALLTQHGVMLGGGAGSVPYALSSLGTSGYVLTSNGASADPSWQAAGSGTVTGITFTSPLTGGTINSSGTVGISAASSGSAGVVTPDTNAAHYLDGSGNWSTPAGTTPAPIAGTSGSIGGGSLSTDTCDSGTATVTGVTTAMSVVATPVTYPGDGIVWMAYRSGSNTVTIKVCNYTAGSVTPTASQYNVRAIP